MKCCVKEVYLDNHLLIVDKPPNIATQPDLEDMCKAYLKEKFHKKGNVFLHAIHRLDKEVSGLVLFARTSKALSRLQASMRNREIVRIYHAEIMGHMKEKEGELVHFLKHGSHRAIIGMGKEARLTYRVLKEKKATTLLEIKLDTGRYHQIRAQLAFVGHPIVGDSKYGAGGEEMKLSHVRMSFVHPVTHQKLEFEI